MFCGKKETWGKRKAPPPSKRKKCARTTGTISFSFTTARVRVRVRYQRWYFPTTKNTLSPRARARFLKERFVRGSGRDNFLLPRELLFFLFCTLFMLCSVLTNFFFVRSFFYSSKSRDFSFVRSTFNKGGASSAFFVPFALQSNFFSISSRTT